ncbi:hypothetical protein T07_4189 [Trichinella nelsoni]|uniref:Uncharacterized protein n=1 Tax=Trichinella nelsoni TaxID=6336 RepID=A0A0V0RAN2_9BILA|nr:hypothetical protein T07_4189 [Trichinella nelsoni]
MIENENCFNVKSIYRNNSQNVLTYWNVLCHESPWILASDY